MAHLSIETLEFYTQTFSLGVGLLILPGIPTPMLVSLLPQHPAIRENYPGLGEPTIECSDNYPDLELASNRGDCRLQSPLSVQNSLFFSKQTQTFVTVSAEQWGARKDRRDKILISVALRIAWVGFVADDSFVTETVLPRPG